MPMTQEQMELSMFLSRPVDDGLDAVDKALVLYKSSSGETKKTARRILVALNLCFKELAPKATTASRWTELQPEVRRAIGQ